MIYLLEYKYLIIPFITSILCQCIKVLIETIKSKKFMLERLLDGMGGMPSTHSTLVSSLSTLVYINHGSNGILFAITIFLSLIIIYDSMGIRYESSKMAKVVNNIASTNLRERLGHKPVECLVGVIFGIVVTSILNYIFSLRWLHLNFFVYFY